MNRKEKIAYFKWGCDAIARDTGHAIKVCDRLGGNGDWIVVAIYPGKAPYGRPMKIGYIQNIGNARVAA